MAIDTVYAPTPSSDFSMNMLFDNDQFCVVGVEYNGLMGYEIAHKPSAREVFLTDHMAATFTDQIHCWKQNVPSEDEVNELLESLMHVGTLPLTMH